MGEVVRFIPKSERERTRLIRQARALYNSIFPPAAWITEQQASDTIRGVKAPRGDEGLVS